MKLFSKLKDNNDIALIDNNFNSYSYNDIFKEYIYIKKLIVSKSLVFLISENTPGSIFFYISLIKNNCPIVLLDKQINTNDLDNYIKKYKPNYVVFPKNFLFKYKKNFNFLFLRNNQYVIKNNDFQKFSFKNDLALLLPTSGSMGNSKFVKLSSENIKKNTNDIIKYLRIKKKDRTITNMPFNYSYMLSVINTHIESGASIFVTQKNMLEKSFWNDFEKFKITTFNGVPYIYEILMKIGINRLFTKYLKSLTQAGGKLDQNILEDLLNLSFKNRVKLFVMYGQTEASPRISYLDLKKNKNKLGSVGKSLDNVKIFIKDKRGKLIKKSNINGEVIVKGKNVFLGYSQSCDDLIRYSKKNQILNTGDLGYFDKDKFLFISGRRKRIAKIYGIRINLDDLEKNMVNQKFNILCKDLKNKIYVYYRNKKLSKNRILKTISKISNLHINSFECTYLKQFPRTNSGKIDYSNL